MNEIIEHKATGLAPISTPTTPMAMIAQAVANGAPVETMERLLAMQERWEANEARKAYVEAMSRFKASDLSIHKNKPVSAGQAKFSHATLDNVCDVLVPSLAAVGISHNWHTEQADGGQIRVSCILTHVAGHSERTTLQASPDTSGSKNAVQAIGSTVTYLQRYTLLAATGCATTDQDNDGRSNSPIFLSESDLRILRDGLDKAGADIVAFCKYLEVDALTHIPQHMKKKAFGAMEAKRRKSDETKHSEQRAAS